MYIYIYIYFKTYCTIENEETVCLHEVTCNMSFHALWIFSLSHINYDYQFIKWSMCIWKNNKCFYELLFSHKISTFRLIPLIKFMIDGYNLFLRSYDSIYDLRSKLLNNDRFLNKSQRLFKQVLHFQQRIRSKDCMRSKLGQTPIIYIG